MTWWRKRSELSGPEWQAVEKYHVGARLTRYLNDVDGIEGLDCMAEQLIAEGEKWV